MTVNEDDARSGSGDRFIDRQIVIRGTLHGIELNYGDGAGTLASESLRPSPKDVQRVERWKERLQALLPVDVAGFGDTLARVLLPGEVRTRVEADVEAARHTGRRLRLGVLDLDAVFPDWPWEYLRLPVLGYVALSPHVSIQRLQGAARGQAAAALSLPAGQSLRVLFVYADPELPDLPKLAAEAQVKGLRDVVQRQAPECAIEVLWPAGREGKPATRRGLELEVTERPPHILLFIAHGDYDAERSEGLLYLESDAGEGGERVRASELASILDQAPAPCLVLLDACWTANRGVGSGGTSVASALTSPGRVVVAMQGLWPTSVCVPFWNTFFSALFAFSPVDDALFTAREQLLRISPDCHDWGRAALHRSALRPVPHPIRSRSSVPRATFEAMVAACEAWLKEHVPDAKVIRPSVDALRKHFASALPETDPRTVIHTWIERRDPLWIMLAAEPEAPVESEPIWFTRLREAPRTFLWHPSGPGGPWRFSLRSAAAGMLFETGAWLPEVRIPDDVCRRWPGGAMVRWEVDQDDGGRARCVAGVVQVLSPAERAAAEAGLAALGAEDPVTGFKAASCCLELGLLDEAVGRTRAILNAPTDQVLAALSHRLMAQAYGTVAQSLQDRPGLQNESHWAAALARRHLRASYALGNEDSPETWG
jgi:hypothetical protein